MKRALFILLNFVVFFSLSACNSQTQNPNLKTEFKGKLEKATFAGGCFWCMEAPFEKLDGVVSVTSGYAGGKEKNPTYEQVSSGSTGHRESVQILYNPEKINYAKLLKVFWRQIDPTDEGGQFVDRGKQYTSAIFYHNDEQRRLAEESKEELEKSDRYKKKLVTEIIAFTSFYPAEEYHQDYHKKNAIKYKFFRYGSGRDQYLKQIWGNEQKTFNKPSEPELKKKLTPIQYEVTQKNGTEKPFENEYWNNKKPGIYVDIVSGEPLFSSADKFDSGTGWPSFTKPLVENNIVEKTDKAFFMERTEVRSKGGNSHLGHVFKDGPEPTGLRYCMNSAALKFIPADDLEKEGYAEYAAQFEP